MRPQTQPGFERARHRLMVCAGPGEPVHAAEVATLLRDAGAAGLDVMDGSFCSSPCEQDLLLQWVGTADLPLALQQLGVWRGSAPGCTVLVAADGLSGAELQTLLAAGVSDFLRTPLAADELTVRVQRALGLAGDAPPTAASAPHPALRDLIGTHPLFAEQVARVPLLARYDASVLILGDTGTGKEVCAQAIHYLSARAGRPWVAVNCGAIPTELIEAELFGHVKGAFTHAHGARLGLVHEAEGGTLFLDEIDALPYGAQAKLLRFLQEKEYRPIGSNTLLHADVRVIAASNRHSAQLASRDVFRQDLLYRLNVLNLQLPSLRDRLSDVPQLALHFIRSAAQQWRKQPPALTPAALKKLLAHDWPGNLRELKNVLERAVLMSPAGALSAADIDLGTATAVVPVESACDGSLRAAKARCVEDFERAYIGQLLASHGGNVTHAARAAQKNRRAFFELMRKYKIEPESFRAGIA